MIFGISRDKFYNFSLVTLGNFFFFCNFSSFFLLPLYIQDLGGDSASIGFIMGSFGITSLGFIPLVSYLIDRFGRRRFMILGALLMFLGSISFLVIDELSFLFYLFRIIQGIGFAFFFTSASTAVSDYIPLERRAQGLGIFSAFTIASYAIGPSVGEVLIDDFGYRIFFVYSSTFSLLALVLVFFSRDGDYRPSDEKFGIGFIKLAFSRRYVVILITNLLLAGGLGSILNFISIFLRTKGFSAYNFFLTYTITIVLVRILGGQLSDKLGRKEVGSPSLLLVGVSLVLLSFIDSRFTIIAISFLFSLSYGMLYPVLSALAIDRASDDERGKAMGAFNACFSLGVNFLAFPFGIIARDYGFESMYIVSGVFVLSGFVIFTAFEKNRLNSRSN